MEGGVPHGGEPPFVDPYPDVPVDDEAAGPMIRASGRSGRSASASRIPTAPRSLRLVLQGANRLFLGILHWSRPRRPRPGHRGGWTPRVREPPQRAWPAPPPSMGRPRKPTDDVHARAVAMAAQFRPAVLDATRDSRHPRLLPRASSMVTKPAGRVA